jgi:hypothetical protein
MTDVDFINNARNLQSNAQQELQNFGAALVRLSVTQGVASNPGVKLFSNSLFRNWFLL